MGLSDNVLHAQGVRLVYYNSRANLLLLEVGNIPHSYQPAYLGKGPKTHEHALRSDNVLIDATLAGHTCMA